MAPTNDSVAMVTGANSGIGKEVARQLAASGKYRKVYLACRNRDRAEAARRELEAATRLAVFEVALMDMSDLDSVRAGVSSLAEPIDDLVMNAGGSGGRQPLAITRDAVTTILATNVLGHVVLLDELAATGKLKHAAVYVGSEAARGMPRMRVKRPTLKTSSADEFASILDGSYFRSHKFSLTLAYGQAKYIGALWIGAAARQYPTLRLVTVSPGNTRGTEGQKDFSLPLRMLMKYIMMPVVMPLFGLVHGVDEGAKRLINGLTDQRIKSGEFYASEADALIGPVVEQSTIFPDLANRVVQDNANAAVHRFT